jgi:hypothetical protein
MRDWILCACIGLAAPCSAFGQQAAATDKTPATTPSKDTGAQSKLAELLETKVKAAWAAFKKKGQRCLCGIFDR